MGPYTTAKLLLDSTGSPVIMSGPDQDEDVTLVASKRDPVTGEVSFSGIDLGPLSTNSGLTVTVSAFSAGAFIFEGGSITLSSDGIWYVGVDLFSKALISLPRLGHRGWIPVAKVIATSGGITSCQHIPPVMPKSRLPRVTKKLLDGKSINVLVLGSSLAEGGATTDWSGMLFNSGSSTDKYRVPLVGTFSNFALGGTQNQYQFAQTGFISGFSQLEYSESGYGLMFAAKTPPNGRSTMFNDVDLVVITALANGGDYRLQCIEPIIRNIRKMGIEVILTTDNPQGYPFANYASITTAALHTDGPELVRIADMYNLELADTSAYVVDACLRYPAVNIYRDSIHMAYGLPSGRTGTPSGGYEVYARAIRSCISVISSNPGVTTRQFNFDDGTVQGFVAYEPYGVVANVGGKLVVSKNNATAGQWGGKVLLPPHNAGDTIVVSGTLSDVSYGGRPSIGVYNSGWGSNSVVFAADGAFNVTLTANKQNLAAYLLLFGNLDNAPLGASFSVDNLTYTLASSYETPAKELVEGRPYEAQALPPSRIVTDLKTPGDAFVILPKDEVHVTTLDAYKGTLGASPLGAGSFARRASSSVGAAEDLLTATTGNRVAMSAYGAVGASIIYYSVNGDPQVVFEVYKGNVLTKTITIPAQTISREIYLPVITPTEMGISTVVPSSTSIELRVTSGALKIAALVLLTSDIEFVQPEQITRLGTWTGNVLGGPPNMKGYGTDVSGDTAYLKCPETGRRVYFVCSSKPNSKTVDLWSGRTTTKTVATVGVNHIRTFGGHVGPGDLHYIKLTQNQPNTDQAVNGYGLHIGGGLIVNDR